MTIIEAMSDKALLGHYFKDLKTWSVWVAILKAIFRLPFDAENRTAWEKVSGGRQLPESVRELWAIVARRTGKTTIAALIACYLAVFKNWNPFLSPGERGHVIMLAVDRKQAGELFARIRHTFSQRFFRPLVEKQLQEEIHLKNGICISVKTSDFRSIRGLTVVAAVLDEAAFFRVEGANPMDEILTALRPSMATVPESLLVVISSPYMRAGPLFEVYKNAFGRNDPHLLVVQGATELFNPTIDQEYLKRQFELDPQAAKAEWGGQFRDDLETFIDSRMLDAVVVPDRFELPPVFGIKYFLFADPSGGKSDSFTAAVSHVEKNGLVVLDALREWRPPFKPQNICEEISALAGSYRVNEVYSDKYAGEWVTQSFQSAGLTHKTSELNKSELYLEFLPLVTGQRIELLDNAKMLAQVRSLERRTRSGGRDLVDHAPGQHDDLVNAVAGAAWLVSVGTRFASGFVGAVYAPELFSESGVNKLERAIMGIDFDN